MTDSEIYTKAAESIDDYSQMFSCSAIWHHYDLSSVGTSRHRRLYRKAFGFSTYEYRRLRDRFLCKVEKHEDPRRFRVLLLLMMAAACDDLQ